MAMSEPKKTIFGYASPGMRKLHSCFIHLMNVDNNLLDFVYSC